MREEVRRSVSSRFFRGTVTQHFFAALFRRTGLNSAVFDSGRFGSGIFSDDNGAAGRSGVGFPAFLGDEEAKQARDTEILERINLGPDKMLLLVSVCGKCMVLGVTNGRVEKVHELEETEEELMKKDENGGNPTFKESFKIVFKDMLNKK